MSPVTTFVIPCFNEEKRLDRTRFVAFAESPRTKLVFVDDGSRDATSEVIEGMARTARPGAIELLRLEKNSGKGEAVRRGVLHAFDQGAPLVGYADADLATPPRELLRLRDVLEGTDTLDIVIGSRVLMVGHAVERKRTRHYLGRVFATFAANILRTPFYDTQCGAKLFRSIPETRAAFGRPFVSRWAFDVELLGRLLIGGHGAAPLPLARMREVPLDEWVHVSGSKLDATHMARALVDLARIEIELDRLAGGRRWP